jgi:cell wall-associated NlpC family hydrolase
MAFDIPVRFWSVPYVGSNFPATDRMFEDGTNCQGFAYAVLRHFGLAVPDFRSSELWADNDITECVQCPLPLDLLLFNSTQNAFGAHLGICAGEDLVLHHSKGAGRPAIWHLAEFGACSRYRVFVGAKRVRARQAT